MFSICLKSNSNPFKLSPYKLVTTLFERIKYNRFTIILQITERSSVLCQHRMQEIIQRNRNCLYYYEHNIVFLFNFISFYLFIFLSVQISICSFVVPAGHRNHLNSMIFIHIPILQHLRDAQRFSLSFSPIITKQEFYWPFSLFRNRC